MARISLVGSLAVATLAVLVLAAAMATLINVITADAPTSAGGNCNRKCTKGETMTCIFEFSVHRYQTYSWACKDCNSSTCANRRECIEADGVTRFITVVNRMLPGPSIQVCEGDIVRVTVKNLLPAAGVSIHWHGIHMKKGLSSGGTGTPHMDGEPGVTQCPIVPQTKFTYTFKANPSGTHFWHAQTGFQRGDGVFGPLIVRQPEQFDHNSYLYDEDLPSNIIMVNDWTHILSEEKFCLRHFNGFSDYPKSILVNGLGPNEGNSIAAIPKQVPYQRFQIEIDKRYRYRLISAAFLNCPVTFSVNDHIITVIASDGTSIEPRNVTSIVIHPGERWDFILHANQYPQSYWMVFMGTGDCVKDSVFQAAVLEYIESKEDWNVGRSSKGTINDHPRSKPRFTISNPKGLHLNSDSGSCLGDNVCLTDLKSISKLPNELKKEKADVIHFLSFSKRRMGNVVYNHPFFFNDLNAPEEDVIPIPQINNFSFLNPPTPLLLQKAYFGGCNVDYQPCENSFCECIHLVKISLGSLVDLILINEGDGTKSNSVHLHGYKFYVLGMDSSPFPKIMNFTRNKLMVMDKKGLLSRNLIDPIQKDTTPLPPGGYVIIRFLADNPGFWTLESQLLFYSQAGMKIILQVGEDSEIPEPPSNFPTCGNF